MTSPLSWFRKNQKLLLGVFGVLLIFVFTISLGSGVDPIVDYLSGNRPGGVTRNEVVVKWNGRELYESDLQNMRYNRARIAAFLQATFALSQTRGGQSVVPPLPLTDADESLVESDILAARATEMGLVVSDDAIIEYLLGFTGNTVRMGELASLLKDSSGGRMTQDQLFEVLRHELLAQKVRMMATSGVFPTSPVVSWGFYTQLHRFITAELMAIPVAGFVDEVQAPGERELEEFYEKYKNFYAQPVSPEPGFKERHKIAFQFARADFNGFLEAELPHVTEQEIEQYYEENKDEYRLSAPSPDPSDLDLNAPEEDSATDKESETPSVQPGPAADSIDLLGPAKPDDETEHPQTSEDRETGTSGSAVPPATDGKPDTPSTDGDAAEAGNHATPAETQRHDDDLGRDSSATPDASENGSSRQLSLFSVAPEGDDVESRGETQASDDDAPADKPTGGKDDASPTTDKVSSSDLELDADSPTTNEQNIETEASPGAAGEDQRSGEDAASPQGTDGIRPGPTGQDAEEPEYRPLDEVQEEVRRAIARPRAQAKRDEAIDAVQKDVDRYFRQYITFKFMRQENPDEPEPEPLILSPIAERYPGLTIGSTDLVDRISVPEYELGAAYDLVFTGGRIGRITFADVAFSANTEPFKAREFPRVDFQDVKFLFWKIDEREAFVPPLDDIRDKVIRAWKTQPDRAVRLALESAEQDVELARGQPGNTLAELFAEQADRTFIETDEVSWMTTGSLPLDSGGGPFLSTIPGVEGAGHEFREKMFRSRPGEVGAAVNRPHAIVYVFRIISETPDYEVLREQFLKSGASAPIQFLANRENQRMLSQWYKQLVDELQLQWMREPEGPSQSS